MEALLLLAMIYAAIGLLLSLCVHVLSIIGYQPAGPGLFFALHVGIFPLWIFVVLISLKMTGGSRPRKDFWKFVLRGCPVWLKYLTYGFFIYAVVNFLYFFVTTATSGKAHAGGVSPSDWHGFSGHWMAFYCAGLAISTSAYRIGWKYLAEKCPNGHDVSPDHDYCPTCGSKVARESSPL